MASIADLWDEKKYSEGDPIRQLIGASKAYKDWPIDALSWGADLVDLGSSGLAKVLKRRPEMAEAVRTNLGSNLRRQYYGDKEPGMYPMPSESDEAGRSMGRLLNPALLFAGNQKISIPANRFSEAKRQFILGKNKAFEDKANEAIYKPIADVLTPIDEIAQTPVDRRTFLKGSAAVGAAAAGGGLLAKFGRVGEVVERAPEAVRAAKAVEGATQAAPKYNYNSLKEYLDDVKSYADEGHADFYHSSYDPHSASFKANPEAALDQAWIDANNMKSDMVRQRLLQDEQMYSSLKETTPDKFKNGYLPSGHTQEEVVNKLNEFSPQAKKEMKEYKEFVNQYRPSESGQAWARPDDIQEWINGDRIPF